MYLKRIVNDIECDINDFDEENVKLFDRYTDLRNGIFDIMAKEVPDGIKKELGRDQFTHYMNEATDYVIDGLQESVLSNSPYIEDGLCCFYDLLEKEFESKDDYEMFYTKFWCKASDHKLVTMFANSFNISNETVNDPMIHAVEEAVDNACQRYSTDDLYMSSDEIINDVYLQLNDVANDEDFIRLITNDYINKNSL